MAFPTYTFNKASSSSDTTTATVTLPSGNAAGKLWIVLLVMDSGTDGPSADPTGFTDFSGATCTAGGGGGAGVFSWYKFTTGAESATTITMTGAQQYTCYSILLTDAHASTPPEASQITSNSTTPDAPNLSPSWGAEDTKWLTLLFTSDSTTGMTFPSGYTEISNDSTAASTSGVQSDLSYLDLNAASKNPASITISGATTWGAINIAIRPAVTAAPVPDFPPALEGNWSGSPLTYRSRRRMGNGRGGAFIEYTDPQPPTPEETVTADKFWPVYETVMRRKARRPEGCFGYTEVPVIADIIEHGWEFWMSQRQQRFKQGNRNMYGTTLVPLAQDPASLSYITVIGETKLVPKYFGLSGIRPKYTGESDINAEGE